MCPVESCSKEVFNLPRHLRSKSHAWSKESAKFALNQFNMRKKYQFATTCKLVSPKKVTKDYHRKRICPLESCTAVVMRIDEHLRHHHKMPRDERYYKTLKKATDYTPSKVPNRLGKSPKKQRSISANVASAMAEISITTQPHVTLGDTNYSTLVDNANISTDTQMQTPQKYSLRDKRHKSYSVASPSDLEDPTYKPSSEDLDLQQWVLPDAIIGTFDKFLSYLCSPDGGNHDKDTSIKTVDDVKRTCRALHAVSFSVLFNREVLRNDYLMNYCVNRKHQPDTVKKYLRSIRDFYEFCITDRVLEEPDIDEMVNMKMLLTHWMSSYNKQSRARFWERQELDYSMIVTPEHVQIYENSTSAVNAKHLFSVYESGADRFVNQAEYTSLRDHLFVIIHFGNGHRSGVTANLQMKEFNSAQKVQNSIQIKVMKHKTFYACGPAIIALSKKHFNMLTTYVTQIRAQLKSQSGNVFLSWTGNAMQSGAISRQINSLWIKAGLFDESRPKNLCANLIRKSISTGIRDHETGHYQETADLMAHNLKTAQVHYHLRDKSRAAAKAKDVISSIFKVNQDASEEILALPFPISPRKSWDITEVQRMQEVFADEISSKSIDLNVVREKKHLLSIDATEKQLCDKIRQLFRYSPIKGIATPVSVF